MESSTDISATTLAALSAAPVVTVPAGGMLVAINRYVAIGIDNDRRTAILAGAAYTEVGCEMTAMDRQNNDEMPYKIWKVFVWGDKTEMQLREWLKTWGWSGSHARTVWRDLHGNMMKLINAEVKKHKEGNILFPKAKPLTQEQKRAFARAKSGRR